MRRRPAFAHTNPCAVSAITRSPRRATTRAVSAARSCGAVVGRPPGAPRPSRRSSRSRRRRRRSRTPAALSAGASSRPGRHPAAPRAALDREHLDRRARRGRHVTASSPTAASRSAASSSRITVSVDDDLHARSLDARGQSPVALVDHPRRRAAPRTRRRRRRRSPRARPRASACRPCRRAARRPRCRSRPRPPRGAPAIAVAHARAPRGSARSRRPGSTAAARPRRRRAIASSTPGAGRAVSTPVEPDALDGVGGPSLHPVLLEVQVESPTRRRVDRVDPRFDPVVGHRQQARLRRRTAWRPARSPPTSWRPRAASTVRTTWVARSRSPRLNQASGAPNARSSSVARNVSSRRPHPRSRSNASPSQYVTESGSGLTCRPCTTMSSATLTITVRSAPGTSASQAAEELPRADPAGERHDLHRADSVVGSPACPRLPPRPSGHQLRRALARADRGAALSLDETTALLAARGADLERLLAVAARLRDLGHGDVVTYSPQGVRAAHDALPRPLSLLHVREAAGQARCSVPHARRGGGDRARRRRGGLQGSALHARRPTRGSVRRRAGLARRARVRLDARLPARGRDPGDRGDGAAAAPEPRRDELRGDGPAEARQRVDGHHARDLERAARREGRTALRLARQGAGGAAAHDRGRRPPRGPVHDGHPGRHRRDRARAGRVAVRRSATCTGATATCRR